MTYTEGWPRTFVEWLGDYEEDHGQADNDPDVKRMKLVPLSDTERMRKDLENMTAARNDAENEVERLRDDLRRAVRSGNEVLEERDRLAQLVRDYELAPREIERLRVALRKIELDKGDRFREIARAALDGLSEGVVSSDQEAHASGPLAESDPERGGYKRAAATHTHATGGNLDADDPLDWLYLERGESGWTGELSSSTEPPLDPERGE